MRLSLTEGELAIRDEVRAFLAENQPAATEIPADFDERMDFLRSWQSRLHDSRLVGLSWPVEYGGRAATPMEEIVAKQEMARAGAPPIIGEIGLDVVGPSLIMHGTDEQKQELIEPILSAADIWCQGFSEPGAGSDLASLKTRAVVHDDHFVLDGQKTWTSWVKDARWCAVLARTDPDVAPHRGISYLLVDLNSPGIDVRPMVQVTGDPEFGEVFFNEVIVPRDRLLGELNGGWGIAMHTLAHERGPAAIANQVQQRVLLDQLVADARRIPTEGAHAIDDPLTQAALGRLLVAVEVLRCQTYLSAGRAMTRGQPGFESSVDKLLAAQTRQQVAAVALDVLGPYATLSDGSPWGTSQEMWQHTYLYGRAGSVFGGSAQIQRNIIAERILGLPRSA
jgi:alkylation response protein AidB-like acyl-CoA dehydrogenase